MRITTAAKIKIKEFLAETPGKVFRVAVTTGGCSGLSYVTELADPDPEHVVVWEQAVTDEQSAQILKNTVVDYVDSISQAGFIFSNPDASNACGCGMSFDF